MKPKFLYQHANPFILFNTNLVNANFTKHTFFPEPKVSSLNQGVDVFKSKIRQSTIYYAGLLGQWDKRIVDQESDVPSIIFFHTFYRLRAFKTLYFLFL